MRKCHFLSLYKYLMLVTRVYWVILRMWILLCRKALHVTYCWSFLPWNLSWNVEKALFGSSDGCRANGWIILRYIGRSWQVYIQDPEISFLWCRNHTDFSSLVWQFHFFLSFFLGEIHLGLSNKNIIEKKIRIVYIFLNIIFSQHLTF